MTNPKYEYLYIFDTGDYILFEEYKRKKYARCSADMFPSEFNLKNTAIKKIDELIKNNIKDTKSHTSYGLGHTYVSIPDFLLPTYENIKKEFLSIIKNPDNYVDMSEKQNNFYEGE